MKYITSTFAFGTLAFGLSLCATEKASAETFNYINGNLNDLLGYTILNDANAFKKMMLRGLKEREGYQEFPSSEVQINIFALESAYRLHNCTSGNITECARVKALLHKLSETGKFYRTDDKSEEASLLRFMRDRIYMAEVK